MLSGVHHRTARAQHDFEIVFYSLSLYENNLIISVYLPSVTTNEAKLSLEYVEYLLGWMCEFLMSPLSASSDGTVVGNLFFGLWLCFCYKYTLSDIIYNE